ncbi:MAG: TIGR02234 family membrane protein [Gordonia sp. (in: high G+C Gram-positive bacteria)]
MTRREKPAAALCMVLAAVAFWSASRLTWARVLGADGLAPPRTFDVKGADWSPWLTPLALVMLAAILAALSLRGWGLRLVALLIALSGVLAAFPPISLLMGGTNNLYAARAAGLADRYVVQLVTTKDWVAAVVLFGSVCAVLAGVLLIRVAAGAGMSSKYQTPAARRDELERQIFADHERLKAQERADREHRGVSPTEPAAPESATVEPAAPEPAVPEPAAPESAAGEAAIGEAAEPPNERMMWDALDTGIDPTDRR